MDTKTTPPKPAPKPYVHDGHSFNACEEFARCPHHSKYGQPQDEMPR
jgi:hypothetical protein